ncbi:MAG TPA: VOC family protein [Candidatus Tumulicola sp.]|jgi:PhnB protein
MTTTGTDQASALQLAPYLFFYGRCEEALKFYKEVFDGTYDLHRIGETPMAAESPAESQNNVMHASFTAPGVTFFCSDGRDAKTVDPEEGNVSLALDATNLADGQRVFDALAAGGTVVMPFEEAFWGGKFGMINDRFGTQWMISAP